MPRATATVAEPSVSLPRIRLRTVLAITLVAALSLWVKPRAAAAWRLHTLANRYADYAACVGGPTGPIAMRDNPTQFAELMRRRIVTARPGDRPFFSCQKRVEGLDLGVGIIEAHGKKAEEFVEYGGIAADRAAKKGPTSGEATLSSVLVTTDALSTLAEGAWPFVRSGYTRLMKPSSHTAEAVHPVEAPKPGIGSGLPLRRSRYRAVYADGNALVARFGSGANVEAYRSTDAGVTWTPTAVSQGASVVDGCHAGETGHSFVLSYDDSATHLLVMSVGPDRTPFPADLASASAKLVGAACDSRALVVALREPTPGAPDGVGPVVLRHCPYAGACTTIAPPDFGTRGLGAQVDVARVDGTTIVSSYAHGVTRVSSSRDQGRTWAPPAVAFDVAAVQQEDMELPAPVRMLSAGSRIFLYGGSKRAEDAYWLLASDDHGASFHAL